MSPDPASRPSAGDRRTRILEAACRLIARRGVRGLRVEELVEEASVSAGLIYYYFDDRGGLLRSTLEFVNERAGSYTEEAAARSSSPREQLELLLLLELQDDPAVWENSAAWGELRASAVFEPELREPLRQTTEAWNRKVAIVLERAWRERGLSGGDALEAAERLTALVEGLSCRWLSGSMSLERARASLAEAIRSYLGERRLPPRRPSRSAAR